MEILVLVICIAFAVFFFNLFVHTWYMVQLIYDLHFRRTSGKHYFYYYSVVLCWCVRTYRFKKNTKINEFIIRLTVISFRCPRTKTIGILLICLMHHSGKLKKEYILYFVDQYVCAIQREYWFLIFVSVRCSLLISVQFIRCVRLCLYAVLIFFLSFR